MGNSAPRKQHASAARMHDEDPHAIDHIKTVAPDQLPDDLGSDHDPKSCSAGSRVVPRATHDVAPRQSGSRKETDDDYVGVVVVIDERRRVISSACGRQWIVQTRDGRKRSGAPRWTGRSYCVTREGLIELYRRLYPTEGPPILDALLRLPAYHPQNGGRR